MIRSDQSILCVEKIDVQTHHKPFTRHKQITIIKSSVSEGNLYMVKLDTQTTSGVMIGFE